MMQVGSKTSGYSRAFGRIESIHYTLQDDYNSEGSKIH
ncbi:hypothetical protein PoMZ_01001 [Pyricularia oryzae]|uniref:Uncharacterized protein n=1 Tax=Pyricularia oryzae TaxID=318829 RepID=A0A4V1C5E4_PYROR|nr:hypothetical protein PoMZ_01001 [Pyricularia oryzae]